MPVRFTKDGQHYHLVPAPLVSFDKEFKRLDNGLVVGVEYVVNFNGDLIPNKGNPTASGSSGEFSQDAWVTSISSDDDPLASNFEQDVLAATLAKQEKIRELFGSGTSIPVMIYGYGQSSGLSFVGNVEKISFPEDGRWALPSKYSISLRTNKIDGQPEQFDFYISSAQDNWSFQETDQVKLIVGSGALSSVNKVYQISHTLSAVGLPVYNASGGYLNNIAPWQQASGYVRSVIGIGSGNAPATTLPSLFGVNSGYAIANRKITETVNELAGSYEISEEYIAYRTGISPYAALEEMTITVNQGEDGNRNVEIQGIVKGLDTYQNSSESNATDKYMNASGYFDSIQSIAYHRALTFSNLQWLHPVYLSSTVGRNINAGEINYTYSYNDRPPNIISGSRSESISINDTYPGQNFVSQPVIGRDQAVLQYLNSNTNYKRNLTIEVIMNRIQNNWSGNAPNGYWTGVSYLDVRNWLFNQKPSVTNTATFQTIFAAANPANDSGVITSKVFYSEPVEDWNPINGRYSYQIQWTYEKE